jgi:hypothetical protein
MRMELVMNLHRRRETRWVRFAVRAFEDIPHYQVRSQPTTDWPQRQKQIKV